LKYYIEVAHELLKQIQSIEANLKRERKIRLGPRTIDLDIVLYDQEIVFSDDLVIPASRMHERLFVLEPLKK
jgi:2-amino-4-hydroxy-6-hydroxymethyldihydropteridine diphosphokinase